MPRGRPRSCAKCKEAGKQVKMVPMKNPDNLKCPECGWVFKKPKPE